MNKYIQASDVPGGEGGLLGRGAAVGARSSPRTNIFTTYLSLFCKVYLI